MIQLNELSILKEEVRQVLLRKGFSIPESELERLTDEYSGLLRVLERMRQISFAEGEPALSLHIELETANG